MAQMSGKINKFVDNLCERVNLSINLIRVIVLVKKASRIAWSNKYIDEPTQIFDMTNLKRVKYNGQLYICVSHSWGSMQKVWYDGTPIWLQVQNHSLIFKERAKYLWLNSVCIDQRNNYDTIQEISKQTGIFKRANKIYVWQHNEKDWCLDMTEKFLSEKDNMFNIVNSIIKSRWSKSTWTLQKAWQRPDAIFIDINGKDIGIRINDLPRIFK